MSKSKLFNFFETELYISDIFPAETNHSELQNYSSAVWYLVGSAMSWFGGCLPDSFTVYTTFYLLCEFIIVCKALVSTNYKMSIFGE